VRKNGNLRTEKIEVNEIVKFENYAALDAAIGSANVDNEPLRFKSGSFTRGFDKTPVSVGTRMMLHPVSVAEGFVKWEDGRPAEWQIRELANPTQKPISRDELGDLDKNDWVDGKDPWSPIMMVAMRDESGTTLTFSSSTTGGRNAIRMLRDWRLVRDRHPGRVPVVELDVDSYEHKTHRTTIEFPVFKIVDWALWDGAAVAAPATGDFNDDLPEG
jgi:hypothetical protein